MNNVIPFPGRIPLEVSALPQVQAVFPIAKWRGHDLILIDDAVKIVRRFAWFPTKTRSGTVWLSHYHMWLESHWTGGVCGGYAWMVQGRDLGHGRMLMEAMVKWA